MRKNHHFTNTDNHHRARELRKTASPFEQKLWVELRGNAKAAKLKFRRQQPIHPYIADFACMAAKLLIELDGFSHDARAEYDQQRDAYLKAQGFTILRFTNSEFATNIHGVVETILAKAAELLAAQHPLTSKN